MEDCVSLYKDSELAGWLTVVGKFSEGGEINLYWQDAHDSRNVGRVGTLLGNCESSDLLRLAKHFAIDQPEPPSFSLTT